MSRGGSLAGRPLAEAVSRAADLLAGESGASRTFVGGLIAGALVGAAVAGASLMRGRTNPAPRTRPPRSEEPPSP